MLIGEKLGNYKFVKQIYSTNTSDVCIAFDDTNNKSYAIKRVFGIQPLCDTEKKIISSPYLVEYKEILYDRNCFSTFFVMEKYEKNLAMVISEASKPFPFEKNMKMFCELTIAIFLLHSEKKVCYDIVPENVFVDSNGVCRLGYFTASKILEQQNGEVVVFPGEEFPYTAPEWALDIDEKHRSSWDAFSLGAIMFELFERQYLPREDETFMNPKIPIVFNNTDTPVDVKELITALVSQGAARPTIEDVALLTPVRTRIELFESLPSALVSHYKRHPSQPVPLPVPADINTFNSSLPTLSSHSQFTSNSTDGVQKDGNSNGANKTDGVDSSKGKELPLLMWMGKETHSTPSATSSGVPNPPSTPKTKYSPNNPNTANPSGTPLLLADTPL